MGPLKGNLCKRYFNICCTVDLYKNIFLKNTISHGIQKKLSSKEFRTKLVHDMFLLKDGFPLPVLPRLDIHSKRPFFTLRKTGNFGQIFEGFSSAVKVGGGIFSNTLAFLAFWVHLGEWSKSATLKNGRKIAEFVQENHIRREK